MQSNIDQLIASINGEQPAWLHVDGLRVDNGPQVILTATLLHPLGTIAADDSPEAIGEALAELFDGLAAHVRVAVQGEPVEA